MIKKMTLWIILIAVSVSISFGLPHILMSYLLGGYDNYIPLVVKNVSGKTFDETAGHARRFREVFDGRRLIISDVDTYEYRDKPWPGPWLPPLILGLLGRFMGSLKNLFVISDFLFPAVAFLIIYLFLFEVTKNRLISVMGSLALIYAYRLIPDFPPITYERFKSLMDSIFNCEYGEGPLEFSRLDNPQFTYLLQICTIYFLFLAINKINYKFAILSGIFLGSLFYSYLFYWPFSLVGCGLLFLVYLIKKDWQKVKILLAVLGTGLLLSLYYWITCFKFKLTPVAGDYMTRFFLELSRRPYLPIGLLIWGIFFVIFYRKRDDIFYLFLSFFVAGILCMNAQLITGFNIQRSNWLVRDLYPWLILILAVTFNYIISETYKEKFLFKISRFFKKSYRTICLFLIIFFVSYGFYTHTRFSLRNYKNYTLPKEIQGVFSWLNKNTPKDSVIISCSLERNLLLVPYTHNYIFLPGGSVTLAPDSEILERLYITYKIYGISEDYLHFILKFRYFDIKHLPPPPELGAKEYLFSNESNSKFLKNGHMRDDILNKILNDFRKTTLSKEILSKYRIDYLIYGELERRIAKNLRIEEDIILKRLFKKIYQDENFSIYQFNNYGGS